MAIPVEIAPGIFADCRAVLIALAFVFGGPIAGVSAMVPAILFRSWLGGAGTVPGIGIMITAGAIGVLFAAFMRKDPKNPHLGHLILLGVLIAVGSDLWALAIPGPLQLDTLNRLIPGLTLLAPVATILLGTLLKMDRDHLITEVALARESRLFRQATQSASIGVWEMDYQTGVIEYSDNIEELFGNPAGKVPNTYLSFLEFVFPEDRDAVATHAKNTVRDDISSSVEYRTVWQDGSIHWYEMSATVHRNESGTALFSTGVVADISVRKATESALRKSEARIRESERLFRAIFDQAAVGVAQIDSQTGEFMRINRRYCEIIDYTEAEVCGKTFQAITHPDDVQADLDQLALLVAGSIRSYHLEKRYLRKDGRIVWVNLSVSPLWEPGEQPLHHVAIVEDITERKLAELSLRESEARLQESQLIARIGSWEWDVASDKAWNSEVVYTILESDKEGYDPSMRAFLGFVHPEDEARVSQLVSEAVAQQSSFEFECRIVTGRGTSLVLLAKGTPIADQDNDTLWYRGVIQDITALRHSEREASRKEERFRKLVESLPVCVHTFDMDQKLRSINASGLAMMGAEQLDDVLGLCYLDLMTGEDKQRIGALWEEATRGKSSEFDYLFEFEGNQRHFHSSFVPILDVEGKVSEIMGHTVDFTEARLREMALQEFVTAIDHAAESIIISNAQAKIQYVNPAFEAVTGHTRDDVLGKPITEVYHHEDSRALLDTISASMVRGESWKGEIVNYTKAGEVYTEHATLSPVMDGEGKLVTIVGVCRDVTQERALEKQLLQAQKMEAIGTLAGGIAHDFNNILHFILGNCELAQEEIYSDPEAVAQSLADIESGATRASELVEQILTFSRASDVKFEPLFITREVRQVLRFLRGSLPTSIEIEFEIIADPGCVEGDATQIHQLLTNLSTNAYHAMEAHGGKLHISVDNETVENERPLTAGALLPGKYAVLGVADNGGGIPEKHLARLFDPFFTTKTVGKGTGLGLSIIHGIVTRMGGAIDIDSVPGVGTTFRIYLPTCESVPVAPKNTRPIAHMNGGGIHVVLVDDETAVTSMMGKILGRLGYQVTIFNDPLEALASVEAMVSSQERYDIAICDLTMPKMDGITLCGRIHALCPDIPLVLATGILESEQHDALQTQGIREVLRKPFTLADITDAIQRHTAHA